MTSVTKVELSKATLTAIVTLSDDSKHVLGFDDADLAAPDIIRDSQDGSLAEYLEGIPEMFRDSASDIDDALSDAEASFAVIYEAA